MAKANYHGNGAPFSRAIAFNRLVVAALEKFSSPVLQQAAIAELGEYKSRGHGGGHYPRARIGFGYAQHAKALRSHVRGNPHQNPHQGAREIARRAARGFDGQCGVLHG
jgi:hypothetical protein